VGKSVILCIKNKYRKRGGNVKGEKRNGEKFCGGRIDFWRREVR
jgi:hypothetical protein